MRGSRLRTVLPLAVIALGAALRIGIYLANPSLTLDESAMSRNIVDHSWLRILGPLEYAQIAPPGFLIVEKGLASAFGEGEYVLRFFPLVCGVAVLWIGWRLARRILSWPASVLAVALFAANDGFVLYSVQVKQYSEDVAGALLALLVAIELLDRPPTRARSLWLGAAGIAIAPFSFPAAFTLGAAAATAAVVAIRIPATQARRAMLIAPALWLAGVAFGPIAGYLSQSPADVAYMKWFWASGFMPLPPVNAHDLLWGWTQLLSTFSFTGHYRYAIGWVGLSAIGAWSMSRRSLAATALLLLPLLLVIAASAARLYPFAAGRLQLFLLPSLLILVAEGTECCWRIAPARARWMAPLPFAVVLALMVQSTWVGFDERRRQDFRSVLQYVDSHWRPGDRLYVYYAAGQQFLYYAPRYRFTADEYTIGSCSRGRGITYLKELDRLRGQARVWILMSRYTIEPELFSGYLDAIGTRLDSAFVEPSDIDSLYWESAFVNLYDLTNSSKSAAVTADRFALPANLASAETYPWTCYGVFSPTTTGSSR
jgi:hypothetical protein